MLVSALISLAPLLVSFSLVQQCYAIGQATCVSFQSSANSFSVVSKKTAAPILLSPDEWPGVQRTAFDFQQDIQRVTGVKPSISNVTSSSKSPSIPPIIVGTLGKSSLIDQVVNRTKLDVSAIEGQWEAFMGKMVQNPLPGVKSAYVLVGADKRGTIFGMYDLSEQFGVSPWYWWADVPTTTHSEVFISASGCSHGSPTVKYRGIFLNDEQPALQNWAMEKFTNGTGSFYFNSPFNHFFYAKLFELMLRIKSNYLWPAIWGSAFCIDDAENQPLADWFGVVMGTSHQEPMARGTPNEWNIFGSGPWDYSVNRQNIYNYWVDGAKRAKPFETVYTIGMRGAGDLPMENAGIQLLEQVISDQRQIFTDVFNGTDIATIPQIWALYKEVEGYYDEGLTVPDDVILLWSDDNWGNVRRFPTANERNRTGGAGIYYHIDYVGDPRDYKWITSSQVSKIYEQMSLAVDREATQLWILNVGDLKPYERETEFFITYGWNASIWTPDNVASYVNSWAQREFDVSSSVANTIADVVANLTRFNFRRKPELLNGTTYSLTNYREADMVLDEWETLNETSTKLYNSLPSDMKPAFFQMVHHPVQASYTLHKMWISSGMNNLRATQARLSTNDLADTVLDMFERDHELEVEYHSLLDGKWDHMMDQTHVQYFYWQQPMTNTMPMVSRVQSKKQALPGPMRITPEGTLGTWPGDNPNQCALGYSCPAPTMTLDNFNTFQSRYIDVSAGGPNPFTWTATTNSSWLTMTPSRGSIFPSAPEQRVIVKVSNWNAVGADGAIGIIVFTANSTGQPSQTFPVSFVANQTSVPDSFKGFVEGDGVISIEAAHATRNTSVAGIAWKELPGLGRTLSGVTPWPRTGNDGNNFTAGSGPSIEYDFFNFDTLNGSLAIQTYVSPSLNAAGTDRPIGFAVQLDSQSPQTEYFIPAATPGNLPDQWDGTDGFVANSIVNVTTTFQASPGAHTVKIWMVEPAVVVQKIVINAGGLRDSYLGPPESIRV